MCHSVSSFHSRLISIASCLRAWDNRNHFCEGWVNRFHGETGKDVHFSLSICFSLIFFVPLTFPFPFLDIIVHFPFHFYFPFSFPIPLFLFVTYPFLPSPLAFHPFWISVYIVAFHFRFLFHSPIIFHSPISSNWPVHFHFAVHSPSPLFFFVPLFSSRFFSPFFFFFSFPFQIFISNFHFWQDFTCPVSTSSSVFCSGATSIR